MNPLTLTLCCCQPCALILIPSLFCLEPNGKHHNPTLTNLPNCLGSISFFLTCPTHPQFSSVAQSCPTLCHPMDCMNLLKLMSIELVMPSNYFILCHPLLLLPSIFPSIRIFSNESVLCIRWPKDWSFSFRSVLPMNNQH